MKKVLIRADASPSIGFGHVMRSVALAQYLSHQHIDVQFLTVTNDKYLSAYLKKQNFKTRFISHLPKNSDENVKMILDELNDDFDWLILDSYEFKEKDHQKILQTNTHLLVLQDNPPYSQCADLVLNHALQEKDELINGRFLFGTKYALIRQELFQNVVRGKKRNRNILVTLGGGVFPELYKKIICSINLIPDFKLQVKILRGSVDTEEIQTNSYHQIEILTPTLEMSPILNWADVSISASGGTSWELCFFGVIGIIGIVADNQIQIARNLDQHGIFKSIGKYQDCSEEMLAKELKKLLSNLDLIEQMRSKARELVDGKGPERIFQAMQNTERTKMSVHGQ